MGWLDHYIALIVHLAFGRENHGLVGDHEHNNTDQEELLEDGLPDTQILRPNPFLFLYLIGSEVEDIVVFEIISSFVLLRETPICTAPHVLNRSLLPFP